MLVEITVESSTVEETTAEEPTTEEATVADDNEEEIPTEETETEAVAEEALATEVIPEETQVETATEAKSEKRLIEENPEQTEETVPKVGLRGGSRPPGWSKDEDGNWYYYEDYGIPYHGWLLYDGHWYYIFYGLMCTGPTWAEDSLGEMYYWRLNDDGRLEAKAGWVGRHGLWYYFNSNGKGHDGWLKYNNKWYYFKRGSMCIGPTLVEDTSGEEYYWRLNNDNGHLEEKAGWVEDFYGLWHYFDTNGRGYTGWLSYNGYWYYFFRGSMFTTGRYLIYDESTNEYDYWHFDEEGRLITTTEWYQASDGNWFYRSGGKDHDGWLRYNNKWYFIHVYHGMYSDGMRWVGDVQYNFAADGQVIEEGGWVKIDGAWYYYDQDGSFHHGWLPYNGKWYYLENGYMCTGIRNIDGYYWWRFNDEGHLVAKAGWVEEYGFKYYFDHNGKGLNDWLLYDGKWYYISYGEMCTGPTPTWAEDSLGEMYYWRLNNAGQLETKAGWFEDKDGGEWYYFDHSGKGFKGWLPYNRQWYYFDAGKMCRGPAYVSEDGYYWRFNDSGELEAKAGWVEDKYWNDWYYFNSNGQGYDGWLLHNGKYYYLKKGYMLKDGFGNAGGKLCEFSKDGVWIRNLKGWVKNKNGYYYYANQDSTIPAGWLKYNNKWYYIYENGQMAIDYAFADDNIYVFESSGALASGWFRNIYGNLCYASSNGTVYHGWLQQGSKWYYIYGSIKVIDAARRINGKAHKFDRYGVWLSEK
ncbi:MAG: hypothetical protein GX314_01455 [Clostridiaceae bacterium]|nr:hypothetical protein [Clostridiaceae bacterium]